jgi:hypothetical protein
LTDSNAPYANELLAYYPSKDGILSESQVTKVVIDAGLREELTTRIKVISDKSEILTWICPC